MTDPTPKIQSEQTLRNWQKIVARYQVPDTRRSVWQIVNTLVPYFIVWALMIVALNVSFWLTIPLIILAGLLAVRIFIIFHDCGHGSFFESRRANEIVGFITGTLVFTAYYAWRHEHAIHHASSGDLDRRGHGDVWMMTVSEYQVASPGQRLVYRVYRNPLFMFMIGPLIMFLILNRYPVKARRLREVRSIYYTDLALVGIFIGMSFLIGFWNFVILQLLLLLVASSIGVWLFYVQHQYEGVYWQRHNEWNYAEAAIQGSSFYELPKVLQWFSGSIGYHHIHHLSPRIPNYNLQACHDENPPFQITPITLRQSFRCVRYRLWDEKNYRLIGFGDLRQMQPGPAGS
ncbi:MAG: fatty acid desaturase [Chloroflexi bacterium]|nr:fatty acid desaturase [Ardenticatenaceae bacterium]MBL1129661.1 fatty acid desaturase [Chloroflexota bacterium]NOG35741.1 fatty acid desaturase [Chloroflexota bacterium]GIK56431.1 MAG: fatty acid desaturase [Chloroflexota bacterium]